MNNYWLIFLFFIHFAGAQNSFFWKPQRSFALLVQSQWFQKTVVLSVNIKKNYPIDLEKKIGFALRKNKIKFEILGDFVKIYFKINGFVFEGNLTIEKKNAHFWKLYGEKLKIQNPPLQNIDFLEATISVAIDFENFTDQMNLKISICFLQNRIRNDFSALELEKIILEKTKNVLESLLL